MAGENRKFIWLMHENGVDSHSIRGVRAGMKRFLSIAGVEDRFVPRYLGVYRETPHRLVTGELLPHQSIDWYVQEAATHSYDPHGTLNADTFLNWFMKEHPDDWVIAVVTQDIYYQMPGETPDGVEGLASHDVGVVLSTAEHGELTRPQRQLVMMLNTIHELGHVAGIMRHCGADCVMKSKWHKGLAEAIRHRPFCERHLEQLHRCFLKKGGE